MVQVKVQRVTAQSEAKNIRIMLKGLLTHEIFGNGAAIMLQKCIAIKFIFNFGVVHGLFRWKNDIFQPEFTWKPHHQPWIEVWDERRKFSWREINRQPRRNHVNLGHTFSSPMADNYVRRHRRLSIEQFPEILRQIEHWTTPPLAKTRAYFQKDKRKDRDRYSW